ncbi:Cro/CI family transcriptional regulator [Achromobacter xylosoxidans]|uniref:Cro/CI family transcriptional regulator n=1 Tax=Alcaligenes xylosoxydans xylosoxydans TaxID=85698 RepID=UPI0005554ACF
MDSLEDRDRRVPIVRSAIKRAGGVAVVAKGLRVSRISVYDWISNGYVPAKRAVAIEKLSDGAARCEDMCHDVEWSVLRRPVPCEGGQQLVLLP